MARDRTHVAEPLARPSCSRCPPQLEGSQASGHVQLVQGRAAARGLRSSLNTGLKASPLADSGLPHKASLFEAVSRLLHGVTVTLSELSPCMCAARRHRERCLSRTTGNRTSTLNELTAC